MKYRLYKGQAGYMGFEREDGLLANPPEIVTVLNNQQYRIEELQAITTMYEGELEDLRTAIQLLATEVAWRRKVGFCPNEAYEAVSNNQTCRTALTDAEHKPITFSKEDER